MIGNPQQGIVSILGTT